MTLNNFDLCLILTFQKMFGDQYLINTQIIRTQRSFSFKSSQFSCNFEDVNPFISVNIHFKVKQLQPYRIRDIALQLV